MGCLAVTFIFLGGLFGAAISGFGGMIAGGLFCSIIAIIVMLNNRIDILEREISELKRPVQDRPAPALVLTPVSFPPQAPPGEQATPGHETPTPPAESPIFLPEAPSEPIHATVAAPASMAWAGAGDDGKAGEAAEPLPEAAREADWAAQAIAWLTGGEVAVKAGVVILFFGVSFLLKYAMDQGWFPIEYRLILSALGGAALTGVGWRLRESRRLYGLVAQGGGVGIMYLTIFAALRLYDLIPASLAFVLLVLICALSAFMAVAQSSLSLAFLGFTGGFIAPILVSTGGGRHVALFGYYVVLNAGILWISWFRSWRALNLLGYFFTMSVGAMWGMKYYRPELFSTTEPFLIVFFVMYSAIAVIYSIRQEGGFGGYVDGAIVFGSPLAVFAMQSIMVRPYEYGLAISSMALGGYYLGLAWLIFARHRERLLYLAESFLGFSVVFVTIAIPLAVDSRWTSAAWAMEGVALVWAGINQGKTLARAGGYFMQIAAGASFALSVGMGAGPLPGLNGYFMGCALLAAAGMITARLVNAKAADIAPEEPILEGPWLAWGLAWWIWGGWREVDVHVAVDYKLKVFMVFLAACALVLLAMARKMDWQTLFYPSTGFAAPLWLFAISAVFVTGRPFADYGLIAWLAAFGAYYIILFATEDRHGERIGAVGHAMGLWMVTALCACQLIWIIFDLRPESRVWGIMTHGVFPALTVFLICGWGDRLSWPIKKWRTAYLTLGAGPLAAYAWAWTIAANANSDGNPAPLPYLPLLNPLDVAMGWVALGQLYWYHQMSKARGPLEKEAETALKLALVAALFVWFNAVLARTAHWWGGVPFSIGPMLSSPMFQTVISISWSLLALAMMAWAARGSSRQVWIAGALLQGAVVAKMFLVDLSKTGTMERIISFVGVGLLLLLIGYYSPIPPKQEQREVEIEK